MSPLTRSQVASYCTLYVWQDVCCYMLLNSIHPSVEIFPTVVRNSALGLCMVFENVAGMVAPYIADLVSYKSTTNDHNLKLSKILLIINFNRIFSRKTIKSGNRIQNKIERKSII